MGSFWVTKHKRHLSLIPDNPNNDYFNVAQQWTWASNLSGSYRLPWDVQFAAFLQSKVGVQGQRTNIFRAADPDGGPPLRQQTNITLRMDPFGEQQGPAITLLNLRATKIFSLGRGQRLEINLDAFNLLNSSAPTTMTFALWTDVRLVWHSSRDDQRGGNRHRRLARGARGHEVQLLRLLSGCVSAAFT